MNQKKQTSKNQLKVSIYLELFQHTETKPISIKNIS